LVGICRGLKSAGFRFRFYDYISRVGAGPEARKAIWFFFGSAYAVTLAICRISQHPFAGLRHNGARLQIQRSLPARDWHEIIQTVVLGFHMAKQVVRGCAATQLPGSAGLSRQQVKELAE